MGSSILQASLRLLLPIYQQPFGPVFTEKRNTLKTVVSTLTLTLTLTLILKPAIVFYRKRFQN